MLRGEQVAAILADYRMPRMSGIDFLEQAMDLVPHARRALLTAYADTDAAIAAINVVDVDHYLLKPWEPPEEKLYPVVDELLAAWRREGRPAEHKIKILGHPWSADLVRGARLPGPQPGALPLVQRGRARRAPGCWPRPGADPSDTPVVITSDGRPLVRPSLLELANAVGLSTTPAEEFYDLVIVGGGPAGLGAAVYGASEGLRTVIIERAAAGGQAGQSSRIENYLGFPDGVSGDQLTERARRQALRFGAELLTARSGPGLQRPGARPARSCFDDGSAIRPARGRAGHRGLLPPAEAAGADDLVGRGVYYGSAATQAAGCAGEHVIIVGGANSAGQAAVFFSRHAAKVTMAVRGDSLERSMSSYLIDQIAAIDTIEVRLNTRCTSATAPTTWSASPWSTRDGGQQVVDAGHLFVFIGAAPLTDWLPAELVRDRSGFVLTGPDLVAGGRRPDTWDLDRDPYLLESSIPGVFVAGDVRAQSVKRVASAVGEGALAVTLVHRYLAGSEELIMDDDAQRLSPDELRTLFLFESLDDEQARLAQRARLRSSRGPGGGPSTARASRPPASSSCCRAPSRCTARSRAPTSRPPGPTSAASTPARPQAFLADQRATYRHLVRAVTDCEFWVIDAEPFGDQDPGVVPDGHAHAGGPVPGDAGQPGGGRAAGAAAVARPALGRADP